MKNKTYYFIASILIALGSTILISSCKKTETPNFQNCCNTPHLEESFGMDNFYIPNIFTPNGDGYNDLFILFSRDPEFTISSFILKNENEELIFMGEDFDINGTLWDGKNIDGSIVSGLFNYTITLTSANNQTETFTGKVCSYVCDDDNFPIENLMDCAFPAQHDGLGNWDENLSNVEMECFN